jgi:hypothetical protein
VLRSLPKDGEPHAKTVKGASLLWCSVCRQWTTGAKEHLTEKHVRRDRPSNATPQPPSEATTPPVVPTPPTPTLGGLASADSDLYQGGGLHLSDGLFIGQLTVPPMTPPTTSTVCANAFFHVAPTATESTSESTELIGTSGPYLLKTREPSQEREPTSQATFGTYMLFDNATVATPSNEMNTFLTRIAV